MTKKAVLTFIIALMLLLAPGLTWARWQQDNGALNVASYHDATNASVAGGNNTVYVAWLEANGPYKQLYVKHWNGSSWVQDGGGFSLNMYAEGDANQPSLAMAGSTPYVAWYEDITDTPTPQIYVKHWNGSAWVQDGGNVSTGIYGAANAHLAITNNIPYVLYFEAALAGPLNYLVKHFDGSTWVQDGNHLNLNVSYLPDGSCEIAAANGTPYVCWVEPNADGHQLYVKHFNGTTWVQDGIGSLNIDASQHPYSPSIAISDGTPYVAWREHLSIYVKHWNGSTWVQDGGSLVDVTQPSNPRIAAAGGTVFVTWREMVGTMGSDYDIYVKHWDGSQWVQDGGNLEDDYGVAQSPYIAIANGIPVVAYNFPTSGGPQKVYVKHWPMNIAEVEPAYSVAGRTMQTTVSGSGFVGTPTARLKRNGSADIISSSAVRNNFNKYTFTFNLAGAEPNGYDLQVSTSEGAVCEVPQSFQVMIPVAAPVAWRIHDCGTAGSLTKTSSTSGLSIGDVDQDNQQEMYVANLDACIYRVQKLPYGWHATASPPVSGVNFTQIFLADGEGDQTWKIYSTSLDNHIYQFKGAIMQTTDMGNYSTVSALAKMDLDHDGVAELYLAGATGEVKQLKYNGTSWGIKVLSGCPTSQVNALASGDGNNDGKAELYSANSDYKIYQYNCQNEFYYNWNFTGSISTVAIGSQAMSSVTVGDGDNDGQNEVYGSNRDGKVYQCRWNNPAWDVQTIGTPGGGAMHGIAVGDADNDGSNEVYVACEDGHVYQYKKNGTQWSTTDLGTAGTPLYALAVGDADNDHYLDVYTLGQNNHVYQFQALSAATPTPEGGASVPDKTLKAMPSQINPNRGEEAHITWAQPQSGPITITIYNLLGEKAVTLVDHQEYPAGQYHEVIWKGLTQHGRVVGSGIYIVHIKAGNWQDKAKICVVK